MHLRKLLISLLTCSGILFNAYSQVNLKSDELINLINLVKKQEAKQQIQTQQAAELKGWPKKFNINNNQEAQLIQIGFKGMPEYYTTFNNTTSAATTSTNLLWPGGSTGFNLSGSSSFMSNKLAIWDGGHALQTHKELKNRINLKDNGSLSDHSTHVTGTLIAAGVNPNVKGMAFQAPNIISYDFNNSFSEMFTEAPGLLLSNHSYGNIAGWNYNSGASRWEFWGLINDNEDYKFGYYGTNPQTWDSIAYNAPYYLIVNAAGNYRNIHGPPVGTPYYRYDASNTMQYAGLRPAGISSNDSYGSIPTYGNAKNIITVGAVEAIPNGYKAITDVKMTDFSGWGPTDDGRIKPDLVADGVDVTSCIATNDSAYGSSSGTSMSAPNVTGSLFLLQEYYAQLHAGNFMKASTLKALAIHTADEAGDNPGPDYRFGWGLLNTAKAAQLIADNPLGSSRIIENILNNRDTFSFNIRALGGTDIVATIVWTDPPASVDAINYLNNPTPKLISDLDLRIQSSSQTYKPWILNPSNPSAAATTGDNYLDNVEQVKIAAPLAGEMYTIKISHKGQLARSSQAYSLIISGISGNSDNEIGLIITPNPSKDFIKINFQSKIIANADIQCATIDGKICFAEHYSAIKGLFEKKYTIANLASGVYVITVNYNGKNYSKKIIVTH